MARRSPVLLVTFGVVLMLLGGCGAPQANSRQDTGMPTLIAASASPLTTPPTTMEHDMQLIHAAEQGDVAAVR